MLQRPVANEPAVQQHILHSVVRPAVLRVSGEADEPHIAVTVIERNQRALQIAAEKRRDSLPPIGRWRQIEQQLVIVTQGEVNLRLRKGNSRERLRRMANFGLRGPQKLPP